MKKVFLLLATAAFLTACGGEKTEKKGFTLTGKFADNKYEGKDVYLQAIDEKTGEYTSIDTVKVENGVFTIKGDITGTTPLGFIAAEGINRPLFFVPEAGIIELSIDSTLSATVKGTPLNDKYQEYVDKRVSLNNEMKELSRQVKEAEANKSITPQFEEKMDAKYDSLYNALKAYTFDFAKANITNAVGSQILLDRGVSFDEAQLAEILPGASADIKQLPAFVKAEKRLQALKATAVGNTFTDIKGKTPDDKEVSLSDYAGKGKYVLVDFWASWCPPCRKEMPTVVALYNKYKGKGFEIVGVSLDNDKAAWVKGIKDLKITWPQISDLKGWKTELGAAYAVNSIPHMVLLDKEGKIVAKNLNAHDLGEKLAEYLK